MSTKNVHFLCLEPRETDKSFLKFSKKLVLKVHFLLLGALVSYIRPCKLSKSVTVCCCISDLPAAAENSQRWCGLTR